MFINKSNRLNILFAIIGIAFFILARIPYGPSWGTGILYGIGCSVLSSAVMSYWMTRRQEKDNAQKALTFRNVYFRDLYDKVEEMLIRMLWFDARWEDKNFDWTLSEPKYGSLKYMLRAGRTYEPKSLTFLEVEALVKSCQEKYGLGYVESLDQNNLARLKKMHSIILYNSLGVIDERNKVSKDKAVLTEIAGVTIDDLEQIISQIDLGFTILRCKGAKNYGVAYNEIFAAYKGIRDLGGYDNDLRLELRGSVKPEEL